MAEKDAIVSRLKDVERILPALQKVCGVPGVSLGVAYQGEIIYTASLGHRDLQASAKPDADTVYPVGTLAKTFTAAAIGILVHEGQLKWDTPVRDVLPQFRSRDVTVSHHLTVLDLLCHRGGLARSNQWWQGAGGVLLQEKSRTIPFYSTLEPVGSFRASWAYSNWGYAILGEIIERVSGQSYGDYLAEKVFRPLHLDRTTTTDPTASLGPNVAKPYAALDDGSLHPLPQPPVHGGAIMVPAMGVSSSLNDLLKYSIGLLRAHRVESTGDNIDDIVLHNATTHLAGHIFTARTVTEKSYACGYYRNQLPSAVMGMGWNSLYVKKMPVLSPRGHCGPLICHGGSLPGYHSALALLPQMDAAVVVCTNSIGLGDASGWISMALVEALIDTPQPNDFIRYATEAANGHVDSVPALMKKLEDARTPCDPRDLSQYIGRYTDAERDWVIDIRAKEPGQLEVLFQGLESQAWPLTHYESDTFLWLTPRDTQAKRGRMTTYPQGDIFKLIFMGPNGSIDRVCWPQEPGLPMEKQCFMKETAR
ncbi:beta-lactamase/transpeptidase-like protein [Aspergillus bertholletiae]|uniref:Beta-lactamase/transpeptidase-like protein n=1 Tax=Aspergillus bertholletiae TaxID=1226010 RepID=A0A5N7AVJ3_9EURO|nr:beta-lactamase/transpeptidase-like protein [Aspergillus bertholletiae]